MINQKKVSKNKSFIIITIIILVLAVSVLAYFNRPGRELKQELQMNAEFILKSAEQEFRITMGDVLNLNPEDFKATMNTSATQPTPVEYTGIELNKLLKNYDVQITDESIIQVTALDGYATALTGKEVLDPENIYLSIYMNGEPLKSKVEGGDGPYLIVIRNDRFSQRWCKFVGEINVR